MAAGYICELCGKENFTKAQGDWQEGRWLCGRCAKKLNGPELTKEERERLESAIRAENAGKEKDFVI